MKHHDIKESFRSLILSASGWRKVFAADGDEESFSPEITDEDRLLTAAMARVYADLVLRRKPDSPTIALGRDSRPTGQAMAAAMIPVFRERGIKVRYTGICAAPEIMAWTGTDEVLDGFCYISASHNPIGHNGVKFGLGGGVIGGEAASGLMEDYRRLVDDEGALGELETLLSPGLNRQDEEVLEAMRINKNASFENYLAFTNHVANGVDAKGKLGVVAELNGSARSLSIDRVYLESLGVKVITLNDKPGQIVHPIVPEGANLDLCRRELEKAHAHDPAYLLGYVPDCDGDRGNLVYFNEKSGKAEILEAQEVFSLSVLSELASLACSGTDMTKTAVAVNGPTSMRIDRIAALLGSRVYRAEVGEANVVDRAAELRARGMVIRILGEGSNGGNITHPARVRDPLNTLSALMNLLLRQELFRRWCLACGAEFQEEFTLADIMETLPSFTTTSAFEPRAKSSIRTLDHAVLKANYERIFPSQWEARKEELRSRWGVVGWEERNMEGTSERRGVGAEYRSGKEKGGFKILFTNQAGEYTDFIWMRGSGTEPVFRVMADCQGSDPEREAWFLAWHKEIIRLADGAY